MPIDTGQARTDLFGINKGDAQIFDTGVAQDNLQEQRRYKYASKQANDKKREAREQDIYNDIGDLDKVAIYAGHRPAFAEKQKELTNFTVKNIQKLREGDPQATIEFQNMYSQIRTDAELSKNFREQKERIGLEVLKDPAAYRDESINYLNDSGHDADGNLSYELDPSKIKKNIDLTKDFTTNVRPVIEDMAKGKSYSYTDAQGNESSMDINNFDAKHAEVLLRDRLKIPEVAEQAAYNYNKLPSDEKSQYADYNDYYVKKLLPLAIVDQNKTTFKKSDKDEKATIEQADPENPMSFKVSEGGTALTPGQQAIVNLTPEQVATLTPEQKKQRDDLIAGRNMPTADVPMLAKSTHIKPILSNTAITPNMRTLTGGKIPPGTEIKDGEYGQTAVMPFIKSGAKKGDLVDKNQLDAMQKAGNVEWVVASTGTLTYGKGEKEKKVSIVRPANEIKSAVEKHVDLPALQKIADEKNKSIKGSQNAAPAAKQKNNYPEVTDQASYDKLPNGSKYMNNGTVYTKK